LTQITYHTNVIWTNSAIESTTLNAITTNWVIIWFTLQTLVFAAYFTKWITLCALTCTYEPSVIAYFARSLWALFTIFRTDFTIKIAIEAISLDALFAFALNAIGTILGTLGTISSFSYLIGDVASSTTRWIGTGNTVRNSGAILIWGIQITRSIRLSYVSSFTSSALLLTCTCLTIKRTRFWITIVHYIKTCSRYCATEVVIWFTWYTIWDLTNLWNNITFSSFFIYFVFGSTIFTEVYFIIYATYAPFNITIFFTWRIFALNIASGSCFIKVPTFQTVEACTWVILCAILAIRQSTRW